MEQGGDGLAQVQQGHRASGHVKGVEERKGAGRAGGIKDLAQHYGRAGMRADRR